MDRDSQVVVEVFGEGKTDVAMSPQLQRPQLGIVPILLHRLCGKPKKMRVKCYTKLFLERVDVNSGGGYQQKAKAFRKLAWRNGSDAAVFVVDSDGDLKGKMAGVTKGRDAGPAELPMVVGVAHPCIESWLLADGPAIRRGLKLSTTPDVPQQPEDLPAPCQNRNENPKTVLAGIDGARKKELSAKQKDEIAMAMNDMALVRKRCPASFAPFADEVQDRIGPLF